VVIELQECLRLLRRRGNRSLSILIEPEGCAALDVCVRAEMRVFLDSPRACLFASAADAAASDAVDLLEDASKRARTPRAANYAELAVLMCATLNDVFAAIPRAQLAA
jgi:hypothetical protein